MTLALVYYDRAAKCAVLAAVRERRPPFSPDDCVIEFSALLKSYGVHRVIGDRYAGEWPRERFKVHGITYEPSAKSKSDAYAELLPLLNAQRVELLDHRKLIAQLVGLERRTARGGRDTVDHVRGAHDDLINAAALALVACSEGSGRRMVITPAILAAAARPSVPAAAFAPRNAGRAFW
jgi:hypothetical protein